MAAPLLVVLALLFLTSASHAAHIRNPFESKYLFRPQKFDVKYITNDTSLLAPGHLFIDPMARYEAWGPQIYDIYGTPIFHGGNKRVQDFKVCDYKGRSGVHLCWHRSRFNTNETVRIKRKNRDDISRPVGKKLIFDNTYAQIGRNYTEGIRFGRKLKMMNWPNGHEYNMLPGGESFLQAVYKPLRMDLREFGGKKKGWIKDGCFQERDVRGGKEIFTWCYLDNLPLTETKLYFRSRRQTTNATSSKAGRGNKKKPWDFMHLNSVDKTSEGDYLVSARHFDQIIKIAGKKSIRKSGRVLWRLGGRSNDFKMLGNFTFSRQHDIRIVSMDGNETTISLLNNAWEGTNQPSNSRSSGMIITLNTYTMEARLVREYPHPDGALCRAMGSMQILPNSNVLIGWGATAEITEYSKDGTVLYHAKYFLPDRPDTADQEWSYRTYKFPWKAKPYWKPSLVAYKHYCKTTNRSPLIAYASWNGATEVRSWHFAVSNSIGGPWTYAGKAEKRGFETSMVLSNSSKNPNFKSHTWVKAVALNKANEKLGQIKSEIFVPGYSTLSRCDDEGCRSEDFRFDYPRELSCVWMCGSRIWMILIIFLAAIFIEGFVYIGRTICEALVNLRGESRHTPSLMFESKDGSERHWNGNAPSMNVEPEQSSFYGRYRDISAESKASWG